MRRISFLIAAMLTALLTVSGVALAKEILGTPKNDARGGNDTVVGRHGKDEIYGQPGGDSISGSDGDDLRDAPGQDDVYGVDELSGGNNNDTINALGSGRDLVNCGLGNDDQAIADEIDGVQGDCER